MNPIYWVSTSLVLIMLFLSSYSYIFHIGTIYGIRDLGFPDFFRIELAVLKILAVFVLIIQNIPVQVKFWAYVGVGGCLSAGRGFVHINAAGDLEPCPFAPFSDINVRDYALKDALQSKLCEKIREIPELSRE